MLMIIPLMNVRVPSNSESVFKVLQQLVSFDFFETDEVPLYNDLFYFKITEDSFDEDEDATTLVSKVYGNRFDEYGYEYTNIIQNMGTAFVWLVASIAYQIVLLVVHRGL
jgi:hypothetical protein